MQKNRIHIEKLRIRLPRSMAPDARNIGTSIGREIAHQVAAVGKGKTGSNRIDELSIDPIQSTDAANIPTRVAAKVVNEIERRLEKTR